MIIHKTQNFGSGWTLGGRLSAKLTQWNKPAMILNEHNLNKKLS